MAEEICSEGGISSDMRREEKRRERSNRKWGRKQDTKCAMIGRGSV
jgi:hypothetical protein